MTRLAQVKPPSFHKEKKKQKQKIPAAAHAPEMT